MMLYSLHDAIFSLMDQFLLSACSSNSSPGSGLQVPECFVGKNETATNYYTEEIKDVYDENKHEEDDLDDQVDQDEDDVQRGQRRVGCPCSFMETSIMKMTRMIKMMRMRMRKMMRMRMMFKEAEGELEARL